MTGDPGAFPRFLMAGVAGSSQNSAAEPMGERQRSRSAPQLPVPPDHLREKRGNHIHMGPGAPRDPDFLRLREVQIISLSNANTERQREREGKREGRREGAGRGLEGVGDARGRGNL